MPEIESEPRNQTFPRCEHVRLVATRQDDLRPMATQVRQGGCSLERVHPRGPPNSL
jgi:hypothetical protein